MSAANYYDLTSASQPIGVRMRPDLQVQQVHHQAEPCWVVKDPHDQQYHQFNEQEYAVLKWLDGNISFDQLQEKFERRFSPYRVNYRELVTIIREFFKKSVVVSTSGGNGLLLHEYAREKRRDRLQKKLKNVLAIQWRGWDPATFMDWSYPLVSWFFSPTMVRINLMFVVAAIGWLVYHYDEFLTRLPSIWSLFDGSNLFTLGLVIATTKLLHELGHAYVHKRFGGECHEIGVMIFFFMPTMYCNTSDSWMLKDKWQRMAIGAGGVYVEMVICALATFAWWFSGVGLWQDICLNLMVVCSVSAVLTNGNPLMRYDGYFVLADWLEIPNLSQQSSQAIRRGFLRRCLGVEREVDLWSARFNKGVFLIYGVASFLYKVLLIVTISYFLTQQFQFAGLAHFGLLIAIISLAGLFVAPVKSMYDYFKQPGNMQRVNRRSLRWTVAIAGVLLAIIALLPIPYYVPGECTVEMAGQQTVFAVHDARIDAIHVKPGQQVETGQLMMELANEDLAGEIVSLEADLEEVKLKLRHKQTPNRERESAASMSQSQLAARERRITDQLKVLRSKLSALQVRAPRSGQVYGVSIGQRAADTQDENLNQIFGSPLKPANLGAWLRTADEICRIGDREQQQITVLIDQRHNGLIRNGQKVSLLLSSMTNERLEGRITAVSLRENRADDMPGAIYQESSSQMVANVKQNASVDKRKDMTFKDGQSLSSSMVQATVTLTRAPSFPINDASIGKARIHVGNRTLLWRMKRSIDELFQQSF